MTIETATYISQLDTTLPTAADLISEGDDHLRLTKTVLKTQFPNFGTTAIAASAAEVNYSVGVTSSIQTQLNSKAPTVSPTFTGTAALPATTSIGTVSDVEIATLDGVTSSIQTQINGKGSVAGQAWTGAHSFAGATSVPTLAAGSNTTGAASTAFVQADFLQKFPNYTAPVNASTAELNYLVGLTGAIQPQLSNQVSGPIHAATAKTTPADADELGITDSAASWGLKKLTFANLRAWIGSLFVSQAGDTMTGPLAQAAGTAALPSYTFSGDANTGVWSPAADVLAVSTGGAERLRIGTNGRVGVGISAPDSYVGNTLQIHGASASLRITDASSGATKDDGVELYISGGVAELMQRENALLAFGTNSLRRMVIDASGNVLVTGGGALGYGVGSGGTTTQTGSRTSGVLLNKPSGQITLVSTAGTTAWQSFTVTNSAVASTDTPIVAQISGADLYEIHVTAVATGSFSLSFRTTGGTTTEQPVFKFEIHKGATS